VPTPQPLQPGEPSQIGGYRLAGVLGRGGQGSVYLGRTSEGGGVAIKVLHDRQVKDPGARRRFLIESELIQRVAAFCTAQVFEVGFDANRPYFVSEHVPGPTLHELVEDEGPRVGGSLDRLAVTTLTALEAIHHAKILHRDFKPSNVIMGSEGPVVIDFGIARFVHHATTEGAAIAGTPAYIAPEVIRRSGVGVASDIFSWASTIVFAATGRPPFGLGPAASMIHAVLHEEPDLAGVPDRLQPLLTSALAKEPGDRPSAGELLATLTGKAPPADGVRPPDRLRPRLIDLPQTLPYSDEPTTVPSGAEPSTVHLVATRPLAIPAVPFTAHAAAITALDLGELAGRATVASADASGTLLVWDLGTGRLIHPLVRGQDRAGGEIMTVRVVEVDGANVVVGGGRDETVRVWDLASGAIRHEWSEKGEVQEVGVWEARPIMVCGHGSVIEVFDLRTGELACRPMSVPAYRHDPDQESIIAQLELIELNGRTMIVAGCRAERPLHCAAWVFDLARGETLRLPRRQQEGTVDLMTVARHEGRTVVVSYGRTKRLRKWALRAWNLSTGEQVGKVDRSSSVRRTVNAVALAELDGGLAVISAGRDGVVMARDIATGQAVGEPMSDHAGEITALAVTQTTGVASVLAGGSDGVVRARALLV
jgi:WD40 repeat protein/predicted Ser/Thr protein kinase